MQKKETLIVYKALLYFLSHISKMKFTINAPLQFRIIYIVPRFSPIEKYFDN